MCYCPSKGQSRVLVDAAGSVWLTQSSHLSQAQGAAWFIVAGTNVSPAIGKKDSSSYVYKAMVIALPLHYQGKGQKQLIT